jgi:hypothetical protein
MVRKGSPVRVRQRALLGAPATAGVSRFGASSAKVSEGRGVSGGVSKSSAQDHESSASSERAGTALMVVGALTIWFAP